MKRDDSARRLEVDTKFVGFVVGTSSGGTEGILHESGVEIVEIGKS